LKTTGSRLFATLLGYMTLVILLLTLNPFYLALPDQVAFQWDSSLGNLISNILMFVPIGFLYRLTTGRRNALVLGATMSFSIETIQMFIPARTPSVIDILANAFGAGLGSAIYYLISLRLEITSGMVSRLSLETPLMGLIYLLIPLLWIDVLALHDSPQRWILTTVIGICGAIILSGIFRHRQDMTSSQRVGYASLISGIWFFIGMGIDLPHSFPLLAKIAVGIMLVTALLTMITQTSNDRRFEQRTLRSLVPFFAVYLVLLTLWFPFSTFGTWHAILGFTDRITDTSMQSLYPRMEYLVAFTVLGYLAAEWRGRLELALFQDLPRLLLITACIALFLEILSGFQSARDASLIRLLLSIAGSAFGGTIYHTSRAHIRSLLGH